jgi:5-oxoprolinase (ATP-hydrolysing)
MDSAINGLRDRTGVWRIALDTGGTYTDAIGRAPDGSMRRVKVPSDGSVPVWATVDRATDDRITLAVPTWVPERRRALVGWTLEVDAVRCSLLGAIDEAGDVWTIDRSTRDLSDGALIGRLRAPLDRPLDAPLLAVHALLEVVPGDPLPDLELRLATTRGTNALLERRAARTAIIVTEGFEDLLRIGDQSRPDLFARRVVRSEPIACLAVGIDERRRADGRVERSPSAASVERAIEACRTEAIESVAVSFVHAVGPSGHGTTEVDRSSHERRVADAFRQAGFADVVCASELSASTRYLARTETAAAHAAIAPVLRRFVDGVAERIPLDRTHLLTSAGGLQRGDRFLARDALLSGPAGGVAALEALADRLAVAAPTFATTAATPADTPAETPSTPECLLLAFDMGGTSTDVSRFERRRGERQGAIYRYETLVGGCRVAAPALAIESVAAGGGSICSWSEGELTVGPESAGAFPGPACVGRGGPLTVTDVHLLLGRIDPTRAPVPFDPRFSERACAALESTIEQATGRRPERRALLEALLAIADEKMAAAIAAVSVREGVDPRSARLVAFGGAGGLHACSLADRLGIDEVVVPLDAGLFCARGLLGARLERFAERVVLAQLVGSRSLRSDVLADLERRARAEVGADLGARAATDERAIAIEARLARCRLDGHDDGFDLPCPADGGDDERLAQQFAARFAALYGAPPPARPIVVETLRVVARAVEPPGMPVDARPAPQRRGHAPLREPVIDRNSLVVGDVLDGPRTIADAGATAYLAPGWRATVLAGGDLLLRRIAPAGSSPSATVPRERRASFADDPAALDLFACRLESIATSMGETLRRTAFSPNVKERLDFSCAVCAADGTLLQNAPHLPVHLGAMGVCVRAVRDALPLGPGDVAIVNHPAFGGSHLPDVTLVAPVHLVRDRAEPTLVGWVATRAHHAEIGGTRPGSFPPDARRLVEEGVVLPPMIFVRGARAGSDDRGRALAVDEGLAAIGARLAGGPHPSRNVAENLLDLRAALAAEAHGIRALAALAEDLGPETMAQAAEALLRRTAERLERRLASLPTSRLEAAETLDDGSVLRVAITITTDRPGQSPSAVIDFAGTSAEHPGNLNAPFAVVRAATLYALRLLVDEPLPMNEGLLRPIELRVPEGCLLNPRFTSDPSECPAVAAGNTETSQRTTDLLLKAFGIAACSQGTMNNLLFGSDRYGAYETICGGNGATSEGRGADAVHTHMTNTRITDVEVLERRVPVVVRRFAVRRGSGGAGLHRGGDGCVRTIEFLEPTSVSFLGQHRTRGPYGLDGGADGAVGLQWVDRADGTRINLPGIAAIDCGPGDRITILTPGGGAFGADR